MLPFALVLSGLAATLGPAPQQHGGASSSFAVHAQHVRLVGDEVLHDALVFVERGKVARVVEAKKAGRFEGDVFEHDGWLSAGLISARSTSALRGQTTEPKRALTPELRIALAVDFSHPDLERALRAGVTSMLLCPAPTNPAAGRTAVIKTHGARTVVRDAHMLLSLGSAGLRPNRAPTSFAGLVAELGAALDKPQGVWDDVAAGRLPVILEAGSRDEVQRAIAFAAEHGLKGALSRVPLAGQFAADVKRSGLAVIVGPFGVGTSQRALDSVVVLAKERVPLAFASDSPGMSDEVLRVSAAMCVRAGLSSAAAWDALTATAAAVVGAGSHLGKLAPGYDADFVLWSGDPLDLSSRVVAVYVDGQRAWEGDQE